MKNLRERTSSLKKGSPNSFNSWGDPNGTKSQSARKKKEADQKRTEPNQECLYERKGAGHWEKKDYYSPQRQQDGRERLEGTFCDRGVSIASRRKKEKTAGGKRG